MQEKVLVQLVQCSISQSIAQLVMNGDAMQGILPGQESGGKVEEGGAEEAKTGAHTWRGDWEGIDPTQPCEAAKVRTLVPPAPSLTPWLTLSDHSVYPVFQSLARFQIVEKVPTEFPKTGTPDGHIRIVCISGAGATT